MATKEELIDCFQGFNILAGDAALDKCLEICLKYGIEAEDFFDQWIAFSASKLNGAAPTVELLDAMERKEFLQNKEVPRQRAVTPKTNYKISDELDSHHSLVNSYSSTSTTPKTNRVQTSGQDIRTPVAKDISSLYDCTSSNSPLANAAEKYAQRTDSLSVKAYFGDTTANFKKQGDALITIENFGPIMGPDTRYMREVMTVKARSLNNISEYVGHAILETHGLKLLEGLWKTHIGEMTSYGRIVCDSNGKMNAQSILLEGTFETNAGRSTPFNINKLNKYTLFPGQVVAVKGNHVGSQIIADRIYSDSNLNFADDIPIQSDPMQLVIAAGPFTLQGNLSYEPLNDILKYTVEHKPDVLILMGPFIEKTHQSILNGGLAQTFDSFFEGLIENIMNSLLGVEIQVVIVSSQKDAHHHPVFPSLPYKVREKYNNLTLVADPSMININGLIVGATTADVLFDVSNSELYLDKLQKSIPDRIGRLASHVLAQRSFYPLYPPPKGMSIDHGLFEQYGLLDVKPHILILPSNLRCFAKNIQDCLVINPERVTKSYVAGTFARIEITPGSSKSICNRCACQILKV